MKDYCIFYRNNFGERRVEIVEARSDEDMYQLLVMKNAVQGKYKKIYGYEQYSELIQNLKEF